MTTNEYARMANLEENYWWHVGRKSIVDRQLSLIAKNRKNLKILNVGSGTGGTVPLLECYGSVTNVDVSDEAIRFAAEKGIRTIKVDGLELPFRDGEFDVVVALDVLEHIQDHVFALKEWLRLLKPEGKLILTVPAYQWLWSVHDEQLHHHRRYTASALHQLLNEAGYRVKKRSYAITFSFFMIVGFRWLTGILPLKKAETSYVVLPRPINWVFIKLLQLESIFLQRASLPFGTSVISVSERLEV